MEKDGEKEVEPHAKKHEELARKALEKENPKIKSILTKEGLLQKLKKEKLSETEYLTLKRLKKGEEREREKKHKKPSKYIRFSNKLFSNFSRTLIDKTHLFPNLRSDLIKAKLKFTPESYVSVILFTTLISVFIAFVLFVFSLFFTLSSQLPIILKVEEGALARVLKTFWILIVIPLITFLAMSLYPAAEKNSKGKKIDQEVPFATIHMAAISGSLIEPSNIFLIISQTREYPYLEQDFKKLINEIHIYGSDLVSALKITSKNTPSKKLAELLNGLIVTLTSGGDLTTFFQKRSESLLFEYRLEREKRIKAAETFMDIYISVVIAAPMILMLILMMMKISGLGIGLGAGLITVIMVSAVTAVNIIFITFIHLKQQSAE